MSFQADIAKFAEKAGLSLDKTVRMVTVELFSSVIKSTPVDTGRARGNWQTTQRSAASGEVDRSQADALAELNENAGGAGSVTYMTNNLPYARRLEEGYSDQAPAGMVRVNFTRVESLISAAARKNKV